MRSSKPSQAPPPPKVFYLDNTIPSQGVLSLIYGIMGSGSKEIVRYTRAVSPPTNKHKPPIAAEPEKATIKDLPHTHTLLAEYPTIPPHLASDLEPPPRLQYPRKPDKLIQCRKAPRMHPASSQTFGIPADMTVISSKPMDKT